MLRVRRIRVEDGLVNVFELGLRINGCLGLLWQAAENRSRLSCSHGDELINNRAMKFEALPRFICLVMMLRKLRRPLGRSALRPALRDSRAVRATKTKVL
jgi:hypothetical protein